MQHGNPSPETILDMLEDLEAGIAALKTAKTGIPAGVYTTLLQPGQFRGQMDRLGLSPGDVARIFGVDQEAVREWLNNHGEIPAWVRASLLILGMLAPAARAKVLNGNKPTGPRVHPFSRIEDL